MTSRKAAILPENKIKLLAAAGALLLIAFSIHSGGEILGLLAVLAILLASYRTARGSYGEIHLEKLAFLTIGLYLALVSLYGFALSFLGLELSVRNFLLLGLATNLALSMRPLNKRYGTVRLEKQRLLLTIVPFLAAYLLYLWPSLPALTSPCTIGYDCMFHMEYAANIYRLNAAVPPHAEWRYVPNGLHVNFALLAHALESDAPYYSALSYPLIAFIAAMIVGILCGMLYDRLKNKNYILLFLLAILSAVYPASALIGYGFWPNLFGIYHIILFSWLLSDYTANPKDRKIQAIRLIIAASSILAYQVLTSAILAIVFILASLTLPKQATAAKIKPVVAFIAMLAAFYCLYNLGEYSKYLGYVYNPVQTTRYFSGHEINCVDNILNCGYEIKLDGLAIRVRNTGPNVESVYTPPGANIRLLLSKGLDKKNMKDFLDTGKDILNRTSYGSALFYDIKWFGILPIALAAAGWLYSRKKRDYTLIFLEASLIHLLLYTLAYKNGSINLYYYSKEMYYLIYPITFYAIVGLEGIASTNARKKSIILLAAILLLARQTNLINDDQTALLTGEHRDLYETRPWWPLLEYNRILRYWDRIYNLHRDNYGLTEWLKTTTKN